jgi:signal transduction histidine kinase
MLEGEGAAPAAEKPRKRARDHKPAGTPFYQFYTSSWNEEMRAGDSDEARAMILMMRTNEALRKSQEETRQLSLQLLEVQELERKRIAADLHDGIGQSLSLIKLSMELALLKMKSGAQPEGEEMLQQLIDRVRNTMSDLHCTTMCLGHSMIDDLGLIPALTCHFREFETVWQGKRLEKSIEVAEGDVPAPLKLIIFRILQEAMNNIAKHAHADWVRVGLKLSDGQLRLSIADNGRGFDLANVGASRDSERGFGLVTMRERVRCSGGVFEMNSSSGHGTQIFISWSVMGGHAAQLGRVTHHPASCAEVAGRGAQVGAESK